MIFDDPEFETVCSAMGRLACNEGREATHKNQNIVRLRCVLDYETVRFLAIVYGCLTVADLISNASRDAYGGHHRQLYRK